MNDILVQIDNWIKIIVANPYFGLAGFVIGVIGLIFSYYVARRDKRRRELDCVLISTNLVSKSEALFPKLTIKYDEQDLESLTISKIRIKNTGTEIIRNDDIAKADPITFGGVSNDIKLLDFGITYSSDKLNNINLAKDEKGKIQLVFDYIEPNDNVILEILHTGKTNADIEIKGTVIGAKKPLYSDKSTSLAKKASRYMISNPRITGIVSILFIMLACGVTSYILYSTTQNIALGILCLLPIIFFAWVIIKSIVTRKEMDREILATEMMKSMFGEAIANLSHTNGIRESKKDINS